MFARMVKNMEKTPEIAVNCKVIIMQDLIKVSLSLRRSEQRDEALRLKREQLQLLREKKGHKSPSSCPPSPNGPRASSFNNNLRAIPAHPFHPKAPEIRRPPAPLDSEHLPRPSRLATHTLGVPQHPADPNAGPDGPYAPAPPSGLPTSEPSETHHEQS